MAPIHGAARRGDLEVMMRLTQEDLGMVDTTDDDDSMGWTALHYASENGHLGVVCYLLDQGADINARGDLGQSPLYVACQEGHLEVVELLMSRGADPTINRTCRWTPLMAATPCSHVAVVKYLLRIRAVRATGFIDTRGNNGGTALWWAAYCGHE